MNVMLKAGRNAARIPDNHVLDNFPGLSLICGAVDGIMSKDIIPARSEAERPSAGGPCPEDMVSCSLTPILMTVVLNRIFRETIAMDGGRIDA